MASNNVIRYGREIAKHKKYFQSILNKISEIPTATSTSATTGRENANKGQLKWKETVVLTDYGRNRYFYILYKNIMNMKILIGPLFWKVFVYRNY